MNYYPIETNTILLNPLYSPDAFNQLKDLCRKDGFLRNSKVYTNELNFSDSMYCIEKYATLESYWFHNRLFTIVDKKANLSNPVPSGLIGLKDIDWLEHRGEIIIIMDNASTKNKLASEPLKLLLKKAFNDWHLRRMWTRLFSTNSHTMVVCKSFGFSPEGKMRKEINLDGEYIDIDILGLLKEEFHYVSEP